MKLTSLCCRPPLWSIRACGDAKAVPLSVLMVQPKFTLEIGAPQGIGRMCHARLVTFGHGPLALSTPRQAVAIEDGAVNAGSRGFCHRELLDQLVPDLRGAPDVVLPLDPQDSGFDLERGPVGMSELAGGRNLLTSSPKLKSNWRTVEWQKRLRNVAYH